MSTFLHLLSERNSHRVQGKLFQIVRIRLGRRPRPTTRPVLVLALITLLLGLRSLFLVESTRCVSSVRRVTTHLPSIGSGNVPAAATAAQVGVEFRVRVDKGINDLRVLEFPVSHEDPEDVVPVGKGRELVLHGQRVRSKQV